ncbi:MAG: cache domain-containing protein, partial [Patescibacteria group bacterium]
MLNIALRKKIIFLFLFFGLLPLAVTFFLTIIQIQKPLRETVNNNLTSLADEVIGSVEKTARAIYADVELLSANPLIRSNEASNEEKLSEIKRIQDFYGIFEDITLIDLKGNVIISTTYKYRGDWKNKQWYQEAKQGKSSISPAHIILGPYKVILSSAAPVKDAGGKIIAVAAGQVNMETIWETVNDIKVGNKGFAFIINKEGRFVAHPEKEKILAPASYPYFNEEIFSENRGIVNYADENKEKMIGGFASFSDPKLTEQLGWKIIIAQPESEAFALVSTFQRQVIIIFLGGFFLLLIISYLLSSKIVIPLKKLIMATKKVAVGELDAKIKIKTGDEIEDLAKSFNQMAKDLKKSRDSLIDMLEDVEEAQGKAEEEKNKTLAIITNFADGLLVFDVENNLSLINAQAVKFLNINSNDIINRPILELSAFPTVEPIVRLVGGEIRKVFRKKVQFTEDLVLEISAVPIMRKEEKLGNLIILHDVTREKMIERIKSEFISIASHQLRTPLSVIKWTLKMCLDGDLGKFTQEQNNFLTKT